MQLQRGLNDSFGISFEDNILEFMVDNECYCLKSYMGLSKKEKEKLHGLHLEKDM